MSGHVIVAPGDTIAVDAGYLRGHGTFTDEGELVANVAGVVERVNKLVTVRAFGGRYAGAAGDVVVGRVAAVAARRWLVDVGARQHASLPLSGVNLAGGEQRRRTLEDALGMREHLAEDELLVAEVHSVHADGALALHARSARYGKLANGTLVTVPPALVRRCKSHFVSLPGTGVDAVLGLNGRVWLSATYVPAPGDVDDGDDDDLMAAAGGEGAGSVLDGAVALDATLVEAVERRKRLVAERDVTPEQRAAIALVANAIGALAGAGVGVAPESIRRLLDAARRRGLGGAALLDPRVAAEALADAGLALAGAG